MENEKNKLRLVELIKDKLDEEDQAIASHLDFSKTDEEIISSMESAELLKFNKQNDEND